MRYFYLSLLSLFSFANLSAQEMDWVNLQFPSNATVSMGSGVIVYTRGYEAGVTEAPGAGVGVAAWIGVSTSNSNPSTWTSWVPATFNVNTGNDDEFQVTLGGNLAPGTYYYASRWQLNGGPFTYGGLAGPWTVGMSGVLTVNPGPIPANNECISAAVLTSTAVINSNAGATQSLAPEACAGTSATAADVWYRFTAGAGTATITLDNVSGLIDATLIGYSGTCAALTNIGCVNATGANGNEVLVLNGLTVGQAYYVRVYGNTLFQGSYNISVSGGALPVSIEYFEGAKSNSSHRLGWKVNCTQSPSVTMTLERSPDAKKFTAVSTSTETDTRCLQPFLFVDNSPLPGLNYYRLKTTDIDGKSNYSSVLALLNKQSGFEMVSFLPNPVKGPARLSVSSATKTPMQITISDFTGRQVSTQVAMLIAGSNLVTLRVEALPAGTYQLTGSTADGQVRSIKFVKE